MGQRREERGWPLHADILELQPSQSWRLVIEDGRGKGVFGIVVRNLEDERLQNGNMDGGVESPKNVGTQLPLLRTEMEFAVAVRRVGEGIREVGQRTGEGLAYGKRGSIGAINECRGEVRCGHVDPAPEATTLESNVTPETADMGDRDPLEVDLETVLNLKLFGQVKEDFRQDLGGQARDGTKGIPS